MKLARENQTGQTSLSRTPRQLLVAFHDCNFAVRHPESFAAVSDIATL